MKVLYFYMEELEKRIFIINSKSQKKFDTWTGEVELLAELQRRYPNYSGGITSVFYEGEPENHPYSDRFCKNHSIPFYPTKDLLEISQSIKDLRDGIYVYLTMTTDSDEDIDEIARHFSEQGLRTQINLRKKY